MGVARSVVMLAGGCLISGSTASIALTACLSDNVHIIHSLIIIKLIYTFLLTVLAIKITSAGA